MSQTPWSFSDADWLLLMFNRYSNAFCCLSKVFSSDVPGHWNTPYTCCSSSPSVKLLIPLLPSSQKVPDRAASFLTLCRTAFLDRVHTHIVFRPPLACEESHLALWMCCALGNKGGPGGTAAIIFAEWWTPLICMRDIIHRHSLWPVYWSATD